MRLRSREKSGETERKDVIHLGILHLTNQCMFLLIKPALGPRSLCVSRLSQKGKNGRSELLPCVSLASAVVIFFSSEANGKASGSI